MFGETASTSNVSSFGATENAVLETVAVPRTDKPTARILNATAHEDDGLMRQSRGRGVAVDVGGPTESEGGESSDDEATSSASTRRFCVMIIAVWEMVTVGRRRKVGCRKKSAAGEHGLTRHGGACGGVGRTFTAACGEGVVCLVRRRRNRRHSATDADNAAVMAMPMKAARGGAMPRLFAIDAMAANKLRTGVETTQNQEM